MRVGTETRAFGEAKRVQSRGVPPQTAAAHPRLLPPSVCLPGSSISALHCTTAPRKTRIDTRSTPRSLAFCGHHRSHNLPLGPPGLPSRPCRCILAAEPSLVLTLYSLGGVLVYSYRTGAPKSVTPWPLDLGPATCGSQPAWEKGKRPSVS